MSTSDIQCQAVSWDQVRSSVQAVDAPLAKVIDDLDPSLQKLPFYRVSYSFGQEIVLNGTLGFPSKNSRSLMRYPNWPTALNEELGPLLAAHPVMLVLNNSIEIYMTLEDRIISYGLLGPGTLFGLWRALDPPITYHPASLWSMTSGARTLFMLPKITEKASYNRLRKVFHLDPYSPKRNIDHWNMFRSIASHPEFEENWSTDILFFSQHWFNHLQDPAWAGFHRYLLQHAWNTTRYWRNKFIWDLTFSRIQMRRNLKPSPYIADTVKHLIGVGVGDLPGFSPALDNSSGPISRLQQVYLEVYQLRNYVPTMMQPYFYKMNEDPARPVYYSLQLPAAIELSPKTSKRASTISDLYEVKSLLDKYYYELAVGELNVEKTPLNELSKLVRYDYFHADVGDYTEIHPAATLAEDDPSFLTLQNTCRNVEFSANCNFVRGCVRVSKK